MLDEYDIKNLNPRKNPYAAKLKQQITVSVDNGTVDYFRGLSEESGIPYETLIGMYLSDCAANKRVLRHTWD